MTKKKTEAIAPVQTEDVKLNLIGLFVNVSRAYEIAQVGNFSLKMVFDVGYKSGSDDYLMLKKFFNKAKFSADGELIIEMHQPDPSQVANIHKRSYETLDDVQQRIDKALQFTRPNISTINTASETLLRVATDRLNLSIKDVELIKEIATVIAQCDLSTEVKTEHIAEAIQYRAFMKDEIAVVAENTTMKFGDGIIISLAELDTDYVKSAIEYLQTRL